MSLLIGIPKETFAGEKRVASVPEVVVKLVKLGFAVAVESSAGEAANFADEDYPSRGRRGITWRRRRLGTGRHHLQGAPAHAGRGRHAARGRDADRLRLAGAAPRADGSLAGAQGHRARDRLPAPAAEPRAEDGRPVVHGRHQRLPRGGRGGERIRPLLQWPDHRRRQDPAGQGLHRRGWRRRPGGHRHGRQPGRGRARQRHPRRGRRPGGVARWRVRQGRLRRGRLGRRRLREGDERGLPGGAARDVRARSQGRRHRDHHRPDSGQTRTQADHRRDGAEHEAGQRDRSTSPPSRAATANSRSRAKRWCAMGSRSSATPTW